MLCKNGLWDISSREIGSYYNYLKKNLKREDGEKEKEEEKKKDEKDKKKRRKKRWRKEEKYKPKKPNVSN